MLKELDRKLDISMRWWGRRPDQPPPIISRRITLLLKQIAGIEHWNCVHARMMYGLLTKCEVKMAGSFLAKFFFACLWTETKSRSINSQKRTRPISSHLDRTNLVNKGFIIWLLVKFCLRDTAGSPERARWLHLARSGSQSQRAIWFILPARGGSHIIESLSTRRSWQHERQRSRVILDRGLRSWREIGRLSSRRSWDTDFYPCWHVFAKRCQRYDLNKP